MIPETENKPSWLPFVAVAVAVVSIGGAQYFNRPLESQRPSSPSTDLEASQYPQFPRARLWQDPLHVVHEHWDTIDEPQRKLVPFVTEVRNVIARSRGSDRGADEDQPILRLLVMLPGTPYFDDHERRRRQRHAVVSALTGAGFMPTDGTRLRYFRAPPLRNAPDAAVGSSKDATLVGYETYEPEVKPVPEHWASVELFWLNTEYFLQHPLHKVSALVAALDSGRPPGNATTVLLGPPNSGVLKSMFEENPNEMPPVVRGFLQEVARTAALYRLDPGDPYGNFQEVAQTEERAFSLRSLESSTKTARASLRVFSPQATIPVEWLVCRPDDDPGCPAVAGSVSQPGVESFYSAIADDGKVLTAVLEELVNRGACTARDRPTVVIVSEQDTVYGRLLGDIAKHAAKRISSGGECEIQIVEHGYLQGVDGEMPPRDEDRAHRDEPAQEDAGVERRARAFPSLLGGDFEQPFGAPQLDYVRRLSERLPRDGSDATPVAIGVLGTDLYDKLLVLQALRGSHPGVVFFTTDMDARLIDPAINRWTRNLIVGSAYGLSPPELASDTFRDSYQVALFVAVQEALGHRHRIAHEPKLFEISRTGFVALGSQAPERDRRQVALLLTPLAGLAVFALVMYTRQRGKTASMRRWRYGFVAILAVAAAACLYEFAQRLPTQEPGLLFDGVSTVPMVMLQVTTIVFAIAMVSFANGRMRHALSLVAGPLVGKELKHGQQALRTAVRNWYQSENSDLGRASYLPSWILAWKFEVAGGDNERKKAEDLWKDILRYRGWGSRFVRIGTGLIVGLTLREVYFASVRANQPLLGQAVTAPGWVEYLLPVVLFWSIFYCCDTVGAWRRFIRAVGRFDLVDGTINEKMKSEVAARGRRSMDLLVNCTEQVGPVVVLPLILMALLMFARSTLFEGWNWTIPLIAFHVILGVYVLSIAIAFQRAASHARAAVLDRLREAKIYAQYADSPTELDNVMEYIQSRQDGAFVPWTQHPILQTLALPLGSVVLITLLEMWIGR